MTRIQEGDIVTICYLVNGKQATDKDVTILHVPEGSGDCWQFQRSCGDVIAQNPMSPLFDCILKRA